MFQTVVLLVFTYHFRHTTMLSLCFSHSTNSPLCIGYCRSLSELALLYCQKIGNFALSEIGRGCKFLQALHLVDCSSIGDDAIISIAKGCRNLKKLHIRRCYEVLLSLCFCRLPLFVLWILFFFFFGNAIWYESLLLPIVYTVTNPGSMYLSK